jgi:predicted nucleic acid-binding protein
MIWVAERVHLRLIYPDHGRAVAAGQHRAAGVIDLLTAAVAEYHRAVVLRYDADFEHIAASTGQAHKWIVPRGTIT